MNNQIIPQALGSLGHFSAEIGSFKANSSLR